MTTPKETIDKLEEGFESFIPENAKAFFEEATAWIRKHPAEAAAIGAATGFVIGMTGFGRLYRGVNALRSMPIISQLVVGAVAKGMMSKDGASVH